jgi:hypothetical protein
VLCSFGSLDLLCCAAVSRGPSESEGIADRGFLFYRGCQEKESEGIVDGMIAVVLLCSSGRQSGSWIVVSFFLLPMESVRAE